MARQPRLDVPGLPQHVVQRGSNRLSCFLDQADRQPGDAWMASSTSTSSRRGLLRNFDIAT
jgi:hypothetical protein